MKSVKMVCDGCGHGATVERGQVYPYAVRSNDDDNSLAYVYEAHTALRCHYLALKHQTSHEAAGLDGDTISGDETN